MGNSGGEGGGVLRVPRARRVDPGRVRPYSPCRLGSRFWSWEVGCCPALEVEVVTSGTRGEGSVAGTRENLDANRCTRCWAVCLGVGGSVLCRRLRSRPCRSPWSLKQAIHNEKLSSVKNTRHLYSTISCRV